MNEFELRRQLRQLPREREPQHDLWVGIEARLDTAPRRSSSPRWLAIAATVVVAVSAALVLQQMRAPEQVEVSRVAKVTPLQREAYALALEYRAAIGAATLQALPSPLQRSARALDASARELQDALRTHPDSRFLLGQLRRTYEQRLRLVQWAQLS